MKGWIKVLNEKETQLALDHAIIDCRRFWERQGYDEREAFIKALEEIQEMSTDPSSPYGKKLNVATKKEFIHYRKMDLGI